MSARTNQHATGDISMSLHVLNGACVKVPTSELGCGEGRSGDVEEQPTVSKTTAFHQNCFKTQCTYCKDRCCKLSC